MRTGRIFNGKGGAYVSGSDFFGNRIQEKNGSYGKPDVVKQLKDDFHNKCYICEMKNLQDPEVEHLLPHKNGKYWDRKFDWNNLFWACGHCNKVKNQEKYDAGIIDCCKLDPEQMLFFGLAEDTVEADAKNGDDASAVLTAELVREVPGACGVFSKAQAIYRIICHLYGRNPNSHFHAVFFGTDE